MNHRRLGTKYETIAGAYLKNLGYEILAHNVHNRFGELDLVAKKNGVYVFVEVKYRSSLKCGYPGEAVTLHKQKTICQTSLYYLKEKKIGVDVPVRYDVIEFWQGKMRHIKNAFSFQN